MKKLVWLLIGAATLFALAYFGSPLLAYHNIREVARNGNEAEMARVIDFSSVRGGLKVQLRTMFAARISADPRLKNNPFAGLGLKLLPVLIDKMVDAYLTPESIAVMVAEARPPAKPGEVIALDAPTRLDVHYAYINRNLFRITAGEKKHPDLPLDFDLQRRGLFVWKLVRIGLPAKALQ